MWLFDKRDNVKPYEYDIQWFADAITHSFRLHSEYNYTSDINDYLSLMNDYERGVVKKCMLAISTVEVKVKSMRWELWRSIPKAEFANVWSVFWFNEVVHFDFYSHLIDLLWLNNEFWEITKIPVLSKRIEYLSECLKWRENSREEFVKCLIFFTLFVENVSLFSQFLIMMSFNKHKMYFKGMSNWLMASSKEEFVHWKFWAHIINIIKEEYPEIINEEMVNEIYKMSVKALESEAEIVKWILEWWELEFLSKKDVLDYVAYRMDLWLEMIWLDKFTHKDCPDSIEWFEVELKTTWHNDFFNKRGINYSKKQQSISEDDLF